MTASDPKPHATLEKWIWILIYGGLFLLILALQPAAPTKCWAGRSPCPAS